MNDVTISMTYYGQLEKLVYWCNLFSKMHAQYRDKITVQFINDGFEDKGLFESVLDNYIGKFNFKAFRVKQDIGFNNHGCRNLAMVMSETHWNLLIDIDTYFEYHTLYEIIDRKLEDNHFYVFAVKFEYIDNPEGYDLFDPKGIIKYISHPNCWLITKPCFWSSGGYDIEFAGMRHGDKEFFLAIDKEKYEHFLFENKEGQVGLPHIVHVQRPNRQRSYLNQTTERTGYLKRCVDFVEKRIDDPIRKRKKRLFCFDWERVK